MDDVTHLSLNTEATLDLTNPNTFQAKFWGFGPMEPWVPINQRSKLLAITLISMFKVIFIMIPKNQED